MKRILRLISFCSICWLVAMPALVAQSTLRDRLDKAAGKLLSDSQMKHAILGLCIVKTETGEKVFEVNAQTGLAPASCQKTITSATAMELLGPKYRYSTVLGYDGLIKRSVLDGNLYVVGTGDPSLGSWRFDSTKENIVMSKWTDAVKAAGIETINGGIEAVNLKWEHETIPGGWIWNDMGNYYGAGTTALNWHENQYDMVLQSGPAKGDQVTIVDARPKPYQVSFESELLAGEKGSGDNAYIYLAPFSQKAFVRGTIPPGQKAFTISGSIPNPALQLASVFAASLDTANIRSKRIEVYAGKQMPIFTTLYTQWSPTLDSLNYWFMKKSINFYGETLIKTMAYEKKGVGSTEEGLAIVKQFWKEQGIEPSALHIVDGSGLSPQNRVTADALVKVLQYAKTRPWFSYYYDALPVYNQMKLKSGTIGGAKSFAGYHTAADGTAYTVAIIINNYDGSASEMVKKMFSLLDELK